MAGNTLETAELIGVRPRTTKFSGSVSRNRPNDFYQFRLNRPAFFYMSIGNLSSNADLSLLDRDGQVLQRSNFPSNSPESIVPPVVGDNERLPRRLRSAFLEPAQLLGSAFGENAALRAGTYFIRISRIDGQTRYNLSINSLTVPDSVVIAEPISQERLDTAETVRVDRRTRRFTGSVGPGDTEDFFEFNLERTSTFTALLTELRANADLDLLNSDGELLARSFNRGRQSEQLTVPGFIGSTSFAIVEDLFTLSPGTYYARVHSRNDSTRYRLTLTAVPIRGDGGDGGDGSGGGGSLGNVTLIQDIFPGGGDSSPGSFAIFNNAVYFAATDENGDRELWRTEGTEATTTRVADINPNGSSDPTNLVVAGDFLYFSADGGTDGRELWRIGTQGNPTQVADINPNGDSDPDSLVVLNGLVYFSADDGEDGRELWRSDGTSSGTSQVADINSGAADSNPTGLTVFNNRIYFSADDGDDGAELWSSDGDLDTAQVDDINTGAASSDPGQFVAFDNALYFAATTSDDGRELWRLDSTNDEVSLFQDINPGAADSDPFDLTFSGNGFYFAATTSDDGTELWFSDGTENGTNQVEDISPGADSSEPRDFVDVSGTIYFTADDGTEGRQIWRSQVISDLIEQFSTSTLTTLNPSGLILFEDLLIFSATTDDEGTELFSISLEGES